MTHYCCDFHFFSIFAASCRFSSLWKRLENIYSISHWNKINLTYQSIQLFYLDKAVSHVIFSQVFMFSAVESWRRNSLETDVLHHPFSELIILVLIRFLRKIHSISQRCPIGDHEVASFWHRRVHTHLAQKWCHKISFWQQISRQTLKVTIRLAVSSDFLLKTNRYRFLHGTQTYRL